MSEQWSRKQVINPIHSYEKTWQKIVSALTLDGCSVTKQDLTFYNSFKHEYRVDHKPKLCTPLDRAFLLKEQLQRRKDSNSLNRQRRVDQAKLSFRRVTESSENTHTQPFDSPEKTLVPRHTQSKQLTSSRSRDPKPSARPLSSVFRARQPCLPPSMHSSTRPVPKSLSISSRCRPLLPPPTLTAYSYIVLELPEKLHLSWNSQTSLEIASLTKIMTCLVVLKMASKQQFDESVLIGSVETNITGTRAGLIKGYRYTVRDLIYGLMLPSGNDASLALAVWAGRKLAEKRDSGLSLTPLKKREAISTFINEMNALAQTLNLKKTRYANPHGLSNSLNRSSALDVAQLCKQAMKHQMFREIVSTREYSSCATNTEGTIHEFQWANTHRLLGKREYCGIKTGVTDTAGSCLASYLALSGRQFVVVVLKCKTLDRRFRETELLKKWLMKKEGIGVGVVEDDPLTEEFADNLLEEAIGDNND